MRSNLKYGSVSARRFYSARELVAASLEAGLTFLAKASTLRDRSNRILLLEASLIVLTTLVVYLPALKIQFFDGWWFLVWAATMDFPRYLVQYFDPAVVVWTFRPMQGLYIYLLYRLFGSNPDGYHIVQILLHASNAIMLFLGVRVLQKNQRLAFIAGILYVVLPAYCLAVFWHAVADPLASFFYLLTILLWVRYLDRPRNVFWILAFSTYILALLSKEITVFLPLVLFLIEWWFLGRRPNVQQFWRYLPFLIAIIPYLWLVLQVQSHSSFVWQFGFKIGPHMLANLIPYLAVLAWPWALEFPTFIHQYVWLALVLAVYLMVMIRKRSTALLFIGVFSVASISPLTGFPRDFFDTRYLYAPAMSSAILLAVLLEASSRFFGLNRISVVLVTAIISLMVVLSGQRVAQASTDLAEVTRRIRVPFRDISQQHPSFPEDTYLYFAYTPFTSVQDFEGLFLLRYGMRIKVDGTNLGQPASGRPAELYGHGAAYVYYFDSTGKPVELPVELALATQSAPTLPARFEIPIVLEQYQVASHQVQRGKALVLIPEWRATSRIEKNYAVFAHLVDEEGNIVSSSDATPGRGQSPTSRWETNQLLVDPIVLPVSPETPVGDGYRLEVGLFDQTSGAQVRLLDANDQPIGNAVVIQSFAVTP